MSDYERIASAIEFLRENVARQPSLAEVAASVQLSEHHFQRLFSRWAGVSPKRFLQVLTLERAKQLLASSDTTTVLDSAHESGLSGASRLYDHFVQLEAVTPSEFKRGGAGLRIAWGEHLTPYGRVLLAVTPRGILKLQFLDTEHAGSAVEQIRSEWPLAEWVEDTKQTQTVVARIFAPEASHSGPLSLWVRGTNFQINVWKALLDIQSGQLSTYSDIAAAIGRPAAVRAVGTAIGANPAACIIPCHRVIRRDGELGGYRWGLIRKQAMLARETAASSSVT